MGKYPRFEEVEITAQEIGSAWTAIPPGSETAKMHLRCTGAFQLASSSTPLSNYMTIPSGIGIDYDNGATLYARMAGTAKGQLQKLRFK